MMRRYGNERLDYMLEVYRWNQDCVMDCIQSNPFAFSAAQTIEDIKDVVKESFPCKLVTRKAETLARPDDGLDLQTVETQRARYKGLLGHNHVNKITIRYLDPVCMLVVLAKEHPNRALQAHFTDMAADLDPIQTGCLLYHLYDEISDDIEGLMQEEIWQWAAGTPLEEWVETINLMVPSSWSDQMVSFMLENCLGPWGQKNNDVGLYSTTWRREWLLGILCVELVRLDIAEQSRDRTHAIERFTPSLGRVLHFVLTDNFKYYRQILADRDRKVLSHMYLLRFAQNDNHAHRASKILRDWIVTKTYRLRQGQINEVWVQKVLGGRVKLMPKLGDVAPEGHMHQVVNRAVSDILQARAEKDESMSSQEEEQQSLESSIADRDHHGFGRNLTRDMINYRLQNCLSPWERVVYVLLRLQEGHPWDIPADWLEGIKHPTLTAPQMHQVCVQAMSVGSDASLLNALFKLRPRVTKEDSFRTTADIAQRKLNVCDCND